jgi:hypothetical protein
MTSQWHLGVPGDDHTLRQVMIDGGKLTLVGLGRSADASAYFLPKLGMVLDAGIHVKSLIPKTVLLTHGHRNHTTALPTHALEAPRFVLPPKLLLWSNDFYWRKPNSIMVILLKRTRRRLQHWETLTLWQSRMVWRCCSPRVPTLDRPLLWAFKS